MMKKGGLRQSLYRNITLTAPAEWLYSDVKYLPYQSSANDVNLIACGVEGLVAYVDNAGGGSSVAVTSGLNSLEDARASSSSLISCAVRRINVGGGGAVNSVQWNPFVPGQLLTASSNGAVKLWDLPIDDEDSFEFAAADNHNSNRSDDVIFLEDTACVGTYVNSSGGGGGSAREVLFHPCASSIFALRKQRALEIWDLVRPDTPPLAVGLPAGDPSTSTSPASTDATEDLLTMAWSYMGDLLATIDKGRNLHLHDPRASTVAAWVPQVHGVGASRASWLNDVNCFVTTGLSAATRTREYALWDMRMFQKDKAPLKREKVGGGGSSGYVMPLVDPGSNLIFMCGSGDSGIRVYEFQAGDIIDPLDPLDSGTMLSALHPICNAAACGPLAKSGYALLPREDCDLMGSEVARIFKLVEGGVQAVRAEVPRKTRGFHAELYPPAPGRYPSLTGDDWLYGMQNVPPYLTAAEVKVKKTKAPAPEAIKAMTAVEAAGVVKMTNNELQEAALTTSLLKEYLTVPDTTSTTVTSTVTQLDEVQPEAPTVARDLSPPLPPPPPPSTPSSTLMTLAAVSNTLTVSAEQQQQQQQQQQRFRYVYGTGVTEGYGSGGGSYNLRPLLTSATTTSPIAASLLYWAVPWVGGGGPVFVAPLTWSGKVLPDCPLINGHKGDVLDIAFNPFDDCLMATASDDHTIKVWKMPDGQPLKSSLGDDDAYHVITGNDTTVRHVLWHPLVKNILISAAVDSSIRIFELDLSAEDTTSTSTSTSIAPKVTSSPVHVFKGLSHSILSIKLNSTGNLLACAGNEGHLSVIDLRLRQGDNTNSNSSSGGSGSTSGSGSGSGGGSRCCGVVWECVAPFRGQQVAWWRPYGAPTELLVTTGLSKAAQRKLCLWDCTTTQPTQTLEPMSVTNVDSSNGALIPMVCEATGLIICGSRGDSTIKIFEIISLSLSSSSSASTSSATNPNDVSKEESSLSYQAKFCDDFKWAGRAGGLCGVCVLPQRRTSTSLSPPLDVAKVELARVLVLTPQAEDMVRFWLPRSDELKPYFQDDVYVKVRQATDPIMTAADWLVLASDTASDNESDGGPNRPLQQLSDEHFVSLQPEGMTPLSQRPLPIEPVVSKVAQFKAAIKQQAATEQAAAEEFSRLQALANQNVAFNPNLSAGVRRGVDQAPILDPEENDWDD